MACGRSVQGGTVAGAAGAQIPLWVEGNALCTRRLGLELGVVSGLAERIGREAGVPWSTWKERKTWRDWGRSRSFSVVCCGVNARGGEGAGTGVEGRAKEGRRRRVWGWLLRRPELLSPMFDMPRNIRIAVDGGLAPSGASADSPPRSRAGCGGHVARPSRVRCGHHVTRARPRPLAARRSRPPRRGRVSTWKPSSSVSTFPGARRASLWRAAALARPPRMGGMGSAGTLRRCPAALTNATACQLAVVVPAASTACPPRAG